MEKPKFGKIKCIPNISNAFAIAVHILTHMKKAFEKNLNSDAASVIIDIYEQIMSKQKYLDIDPFIHTMKYFDISDFGFFFSSVIKTIYGTEKEFGSNSFQAQICFTTLQDCQSKEPISSCLFDISLINSWILSKIIQKHYEFSRTATTKPDFLFFHPIYEEAIDKLTIDNEIILNLTYILSIIVVKQIQEEYHNYILFIYDSKKWFQIKDENILPIEIDFNKIIKHKKHIIELIGYCRRPVECILPFDTSPPSQLEYCDLDNFKISPYIVTFVEFNATEFQKSYETHTFEQIEERDNYLKSLEEKHQQKKLFYDSSKSFCSKETFDKDTSEKDEHNLTVYAYDPDTLSEDPERPIQIFIFEYHNELSTIKEEKLRASKIFSPSTKTMEDICEYCYYNFTDDTEIFYLIDDSKDQPFQKIIKDENPISNFTDSNNSIFICYIPSKLNDTFNEQDLVFYKPNTEEIEEYEKLIIKRYLRTLLFADDKKVKITYFLYKLTDENTINDLIISNEIITNASKANILIYSIKNIDEEFKIIFYDRSTKISDLPQLIYVQRNPIAKKASSYRVCIIFDANDNSFSINQNVTSFVIAYNPDSFNVESIKNSIEKYLKLNDVIGSNSLSLYKFENEIFVEITKNKDLPNNVNVPIFISWPKSTYDKIINKINEYIDSSTDPIRIS